MMILKFRGAVTNPADSTDCEIAAGSLATALVGESPQFATVFVGDGSAAAPSFAFTSEPTLGIYRNSALDIRIAGGGGDVFRFSAGNGFINSAAQYLAWGSSGVSTPDLLLTRVSGGVLKIAHGTSTSTAELDVSGGSGGFISAVKCLTELTTIAAAATTDTAIQMPANAVVLAVSVRVVTIIPTAATFTVGDSGSAARFNTAAVTVAAGSTDAGTKAGAYYNAGALSVRITPNLTPGAATGQVRVTIYYYTVTPSTS